MSEQRGFFDAEFEADMRIKRANPVNQVAEEHRRRAGKASQILALLESGPKTNAELSAVSLRYGACIHALRKSGHRIDTEAKGQGLFIYRLNP